MTSCFSLLLKNRNNSPMSCFMLFFNMERQYVTQSVPCKLRHHMTTNYKSQCRLMVVLSMFSENIICQETIRECLCLYAPRSCMFFVFREDDDVTTCAFSKGCGEVNGTAVKAVKIVMNNYWQTSSVTSMMSQLGWEEIRVRRARIKTILLFKIVNNPVDIPPEPFLIPTGAITRGHNIRFLQPHTRTITMQYSFSPSAIRTWNTLPEQLVSMTFLEDFRKTLANTTIVPLNYSFCF